MTYNHDHGDIPLRTRRDDLAAKSIADAIVSSKTGIGATKRGQRTGRFDPLRAGRMATGNFDVFKRPAGQKPSKVRVVILIDCSGSMDGPVVNQRPDGTFDIAKDENLFQNAADVARNLAEAITDLRDVEASMVGFTTGMLPGGDIMDRSRRTCDLYPIWEKGEETSEVDMLGNIRMGGTDEGHALALGWDLVMEPALQPGEQPLIIIVSDGCPSDRDHVTTVVDDLRDQKDCPVVSVALNRSAAQPTMYGADNVVEYNGSGIALGFDLASVIGGVL